MLAAPDVTLEQAVAFLRDHLGREADAIELVGEGAWSRCFGFRRGDDDLVIRFGPMLEFFEKDRHAAGFARPGLPVPAVHEIGTAFDGSFAISDRVRGAVLEDLTVADWRATLPSLLALLDALRAADVDAPPGFGDWDATGRPRYPAWRTWLLHLGDDGVHEKTYGWREKLAAAPIDHSVVPEGLALVAELADSAPTERWLIHADLINRNVLSQDGRITGVFDWGCGLYGDFLYELAWLKFWSPWHPALASSDIVEDVRNHLAATGVVVPDFDDRLRCCLLHVGLNHHPWCVIVEDFDSLTKVNERTRMLIDGQPL